MINEVVVFKFKKVKGGGGIVVVLMYGIVIEVFVKEGDCVFKGV